MACITYYTYSCCAYSVGAIQHSAVHPTYTAERGVVYHQKNTIKLIFRLRLVSQDDVTSYFHPPPPNGVQVYRTTRPRQCHGSLHFVYHSVLDFGPVFVDSQIQSIIAAYLNDKRCNIASAWIKDSSSFRVRRSFLDFPGFVMGRHWSAGPRLGRAGLPGPARPIDFSYDGPRPSPAHQFFRGQAAAWPSPSHFQISTARPIRFSNISAWSGPANEIGGDMGSIGAGPPFPLAGR